MYVILSLVKQISFLFCLCFFLYLLKFFGTLIFCSPDSRIFCNAQHNPCPSKVILNIWLSLLSSLLHAKKDTWCNSWLEALQYVKAIWKSSSHIQLGLSAITEARKLIQTLWKRRGENSGRKLKISLCHSRLSRSTASGLESFLIDQRHKKRLNLAHKLSLIH